MPTGSTVSTTPYSTPWGRPVPGPPRMISDRGSSPSPLTHLAGSLGSRSRGSLFTADSSNWAISPAEDDESDSLAHLNVAERWWRAHQPWLERCGYLLRPRYRQDWVPSWEERGTFPKRRTPEDIIELPVRFRARTLESHIAHILWFYDLGYVEEDRCHEVRWGPRPPSPYFGGEGSGRSGYSPLPHFWRSKWRAK